MKLPHRYLVRAKAALVNSVLLLGVMLFNSTSVQAAVVVVELTDLHRTALLTIVETPEKVTATIIGSDFFGLDSSTVYSNVGEYWLSTFSINQQSRWGSKIPNDFLSINGTLQHIKSPPGHADGIGIPFSYNLQLGGVSVPGNSSKAETWPHESHNDIFTARLSGTFNAADITGWTLVVTGTHVVPVPAALWLFGSGLFVLFGMKKACRWRTCS